MGPRAAWERRQARRREREAQAAADNPDLMASLDEAEQDLAAGRTVTLDEVRDELDGGQ